MSAPTSIRLQRIRRRTSDRLDQTLDALPLLPSIVSQMLALDARDAGFADQVERLVRLDPPLAARLLQVAQIKVSPAAKPIATIPAAIARIGAERLTSLVTSVSVMRVFVPLSEGQRNLWRHSLQVAVAARTFAQLRPELMVAPEEAYLAGLLHDIGRFAMFERGPEDLGAVEEFGWKNPADLIRAEMAICGYDHAELGWLVCSRWALPETVSTLVRDHHVYESEGRRRWPPEMERLVSLVQLADDLSCLLLHDPRVSSGDEQARGARLTDYFNRRPSAPFSAAELAGHVGAIDARSRELGGDLLEIFRPQRDPC